MDVNVISIVASAVAIAAPAIKAVIDLVRSFAKNRNEKEFEAQLSAMLKESAEAEALVSKFNTEGTVSSKNPETYEEARALIGKALEQTSTNVRASVQEGMDQPSEHGRFNYVTKLLKNSSANIEKGK